MNIEDLTIMLVTKCNLPQYDLSIATSFYDQICRGNGFTEKQSKLALTILSRHQFKLSVAINKDISQYLNNPVYKLPIRTINTMKRISVVSSNEHGKEVKVEFPFNERIVEQIRKERGNLHYAAWNPEERAWMFALSERIFPLLSNLVYNEGFVPDAEFEEYLDQFNHVQENLENYVPMVTYRNGTPQFLNVSKYVTQPTSTNLIETLFSARKVGIHTWDETVSDKLAEQNVKKVIVDFLNENPGITFTVNLEENTFSDVIDLIKHIGPTVFVIPGATEFEKTSNSVEHLLANGIKKEEISVLFRLPSETGEKFNNYVKETELNNPITNNTKAVFISGKVPKPVIDIGIKFESVVNFSIYSVHYTLREFIKNHHNVIHVLEKNTQRNINFASL
jgi:hypothetical protein